MPTTGAEKSRGGLAARGIGFPNSNGETLALLCNWHARNNKALCIAEFVKYTLPGLERKWPIQGVEGQLESYA